MELKAQLNYLRIAPRKVRLVANVVKGRDVRDALLELDHLPKRSALPLSKLIRSAIANAKHNFQIPEKGLYVKNILVDGGPMQKRFTPRAFGRAAPIRKRTSHISLILETREEVQAKTLKKSAPIVRDAQPEDIRSDENTGREKNEGPTNARKNTPGFVQRMFRRKAI